MHKLGIIFFIIYLTNTIGIALSEERLYIRTKRIGRPDDRPKRFTEIDKSDSQKNNILQREKEILEEIYDDENKINTTTVVNEGESSENSLPNIDVVNSTTPAVYEDAVIPERSTALNEEPKVIPKEYVSSYSHYENLNQDEIPSHFGPLEKNTIKIISNVDPELKKRRKNPRQKSNLNVKKRSDLDDGDDRYKNDYQESKDFNKEQFHQTPQNQEISSIESRENDLQRKVEFSDLFFRAYTKPLDNGQNEASFSASKKSAQMNNIKRRDSSQKKEDSLLQRLYTTTQNFFCAILPIFKGLICPKSQPRTDSINLQMSDKYGYEDTDFDGEVNEPSLIVTEMCPVGTLVTHLNLCLYFVLKEARFSETKSICSSLAEGGTIWNANMDAVSANNLLTKEKVITGQYSAWIDGVFFEDTLVGSGHFDSDYKNWIRLGTVRGKRTNKNHIVLNSIDGDVFYSYSEGRSLFPFICQCPSQEVEQYVWDKEPTFAERRYGSDYANYYGA